MGEPLLLLPRDRMRVSIKFLDTAPVPYLCRDFLRVSLVYGRLGLALKWQAFVSD
jgi:hypothetical protein